MHRSITKFGLEPLSTSSWEGESKVLEEKRSGVQGTATFGYSPSHFQFLKTSTAHLKFPKCADSEMEDLRDEKGRNVFGAVDSVH